MMFLRLVFLVFATIVVVLFTYFWAVVQIPGLKGIASQDRGATGIDIYGISSLTLHSPLYWLVAVAILAGAGWICWRWVF